MPVIKSAEKKLRKDRLRTKRNKDLSQLVKRAVKKARKLPKDATVREAVKLLDKAAKKNLIHKNKASRIKSKLSKLIKKPSKKSETKTTKSSKKSKAKTS